VDVAVRSWRRAPLAAIAWLAPDGTPDVASVFPLTDGDRPLLALPYARLALARALDASTEVVLAVTSSPEGVDDPPVTVRGRAEVIEDPNGDRFHDSGLIEMELAKYPASRRRLDSLLLRREHWWFLPRLLVTIGGLGGAHTISEDEAFLVGGGTSLDVGPCHLVSRDPLALRIGDDVVGSLGRDRAGPRPAVVLEHGGDLPELERSWERRWTGTLVGSRFETDSVSGDGPQERTLTLRQRMRAEKQLERACKAGLRAAGHT
jgi:hypothetical protein